MSNNKRSFRYIDLEKLPNGNLKISLNEDGKEEVADLKKGGERSDDDIFYDLFDDVQGNSEYEYHNDLGSMGFGLTEAPGITDGYYYDDDGEFTDKGHDDSEVYFYEKYMITSPLEVMTEDGSVTFTRIEKDTMATGGNVGNELQEKIDHINKTYDGVTASKMYSDNRIQVVSPYFNTLSEIKRKEFNGSGLLQKEGNSSSYVLYSNKSYFSSGGSMATGGGVGEGKLIGIGTEIIIPQFGHDRNVKMRLTEIVPLSDADIKEGLGDHSYHFVGSKGRSQYYPYSILKKRMDDGSINFIKKLEAGGSMATGGKVGHEFYSWEVAVPKENAEEFRAKLWETSVDLPWDSYGEREHFDNIIFEFTQSQYDKISHKGFVTELSTGEGLEKMKEGGSVGHKKYWIKDALSGGKNKGSLRRTAMRKGLLRNDDEKLSKTDLHKLEHMGGKTARQAHLAETLGKFKDGGSLKGSSFSDYYTQHGSLFGGSYFSNSPKMKEGGSVLEKQNSIDKIISILNGLDGRGIDFYDESDVRVTLQDYSAEKLKRYTKEISMSEEEYKKTMINFLNYLDGRGITFEDEDEAVKHFSNGGETKMGGGGNVGEKYTVGTKFYDTRYDKVAEIVAVPEDNGLVQFKYYNATGTEFEADGNVHGLIKNQFEYLVEKGAYQISKNQKFGEGGLLGDGIVNEIANGYLSAVLFTSTDDDDEPLDRNYDVDDFEPKTKATVMKMVEQYIADNKGAIEASGLENFVIGMDIWYAQSGQGAGFFDHNKVLGAEVMRKLYDGAKEFGDLSAHVFAQDGFVYIEGIKMKDGGKMAFGGSVKSRHREIPELKNKKISATFDVDNQKLKVNDGKNEIAVIDVEEMEDFWNTVKIDGKEYDINLFMDTSMKTFPKSFKAALYPVVDGNVDTKTIHSIDDLRVINYKKTESDYGYGE